MKRSVGSGKPIKVRGTLGAAASIVCGVLAACGQSESNPGEQAQSGGGRGSSSGGSNSRTGGAPSTQGGEPGEAGAAGDPASGAGDNSGGAPNETGGTPNAGTGGSTAAGGIASGGSAGDGAAAQSGAGDDAGGAGAGGSSSLVPVGKAGFAACGSLECPLEEFEKACCWNHDSNTSECDSPEHSCTFGQAVHILRCDETADCPASIPDERTGCTFDWRNGGGRAECSAPLASPQLEANMVIIQLCNPDDPDDDCGSGTCQPVTDHALLSGLLPTNFHACY